MTQVQTNWRIWCRLCAAEDSKSDAIINYKDEEENNCSSLKIFQNKCLLNDIKKYFDIDMSLEDQLPNLLCAECFEKMTSISAFAKRVAQVQQMFQIISSCENNEIDVHNIRQEYLATEDNKLQIDKYKNFDKSHFEIIEVKTKEEEVLHIIDNAEAPLCVKLESDLADDNLMQQNNFEWHIPIENEDVEAVDTFQKEITGKDEISKDSIKNKFENVIVRKRGRPSKGTIVLSAQKKRKKKCTDKYEFLCELCQRQFRCINNYRHHMKQIHKINIPPPNKKCEECNKIFPTAANLRRHMNVHLPEDQRKFETCIHCESKFSSRDNLQTHIKNVHMDGGFFVCEECGVVMRTAGSLKSHMLTHSDSAPNQCEICYKNFKSKARLKRHLEIHEEKKYVCKKCGLILSSSTTLRQHLLVHTEEMPHKCDYCGRTFKRSKGLKTHLILHTGLKPYSCQWCNRTFATGSNCRSHKKKAHPQEFTEWLASNGQDNCTRNIPKLETLKAITKSADNLLPVVSKQSGNFAFGKKNNTTIVPMEDEKEEKLEQERFLH